MKHILLGLFLISILFNLMTTVVEGKKKVKNRFKKAKLNNRMRWLNLCSFVDGFHEGGYLKIFNTRISGPFGS